MEPQHYKYINITRGIAILMVICVHVGQHVLGFNGVLKKISSYGQMGVQLFFIASALTLCLSWRAREGSNNYCHFIIRRFFRIAPMYLLGGAFYFLMARIDLVYWNSGFAANFKYNLLNVTSNIFLVHGFIREANNNVVPGGWSIGAEFAFYLIFPALAAAFFKGWRKSVIFIFFSLSICWVSYVAISGQPYIINSFEYYNPFSQLIVFSFGFILYGMDVNKLSVNKSTLLLIPIMLLAFSFYLFINFRSGVIVWINLTAVSLAFCCIIVFLGKFSINLDFLNNIGVVSFSMYINHFFIVWFIVPFITRETSAYIDGSVNYMIMLMLTVSSSYVMAKWTYENIEKRFINFSKVVIEKIK